MEFSKVIRLGKTMEGSVFAKIAYKDGRLSISGVIGPMRNGNARGSCGQIILSFREYDHRGDMSLSQIAAAPAWTGDMIKRFFDAWQLWHMNNAIAGSPGQEKFLRANPIAPEEYATKSHFEVASAKLAEAGLNPDPRFLIEGRAYKYGSRWLRKDVPAEVLEFLRALPDTDMVPAWV